MCNDKTQAGAPEVNGSVRSDEAVLRDLLGDAILHLEGIAEEADRTLRRVRSALSSLDERNSTKKLG